MFVCGWGGRHTSNSSSPISHRGGQGPFPGLGMWDLWWTKWHWDRISLSASVSLTFLIPPTASYLGAGTVGSPQSGGPSLTPTLELKTIGGEQIFLSPESLAYSQMCS
jgi:hypothetical protein